MLLILNNLSLSIGEHARTTWIAPRGAPQDGYAGRPSNPEMILITALTPTWQPEFVPPQLMGRPQRRELQKAQWDM
jgi:hypothetical protein